MGVMSSIGQWCRACGMHGDECPCPLDELAPSTEPPPPPVPAESGERPRRDHIITYARALLPQCLASMTFERWCCAKGLVPTEVSWVPDYHADRDAAAWRDAIALAERTFNGEPSQ